MAKKTHRRIVETTVSLSTGERLDIDQRQGTEFVSSTAGQVLQIVARFCSQDVASGCSMAVKEEDGAMGSSDVTFQCRRFEEKGEHCNDPKNTALAADKLCQVLQPHLGEITGNY